MIERGRPGRKWFGLFSHISKPRETCYRLCGIISMKKERQIESYGGGAMRKMTVKQARKVRDALMIGGTIIVLLAYFWKPFVCVGVIVGLSGLIPHFLYNRCPHCGKQLYRNEGKYCQYCGKQLDD